MRPRQALEIITAVAIALVTGALLLFALTLPAHAAQEITPDTACGARAVGRLDAGPQRGAVVEREVPGQRVDASGRWVMCSMPPPPPDCAPTRILVWRGSNAQWCQSQRRDLPPGALGDVHFQRGVRNGTPLAQAQGPYTGWRVYECRQTDAGPRWVSVRTYCR